MRYLLVVAIFFSIFLVQNDAICDVKSVLENTNKETPQSEPSLESSKKSIAPNEDRHQPLSESMYIEKPGVQGIIFPGMKMVGGLAAVLALIFVAAYISRRLGLAGNSGQRLNVIETLSLGPKERIALIQVYDQQLVVSITPQSMSLLKELDNPAPPTQGAKIVPSGDIDFSAKLQQMLVRK